MSTYIDKAHRVKKIKGWWVPQWKQGFLRWGIYKLKVADTSIGSMSMFSESPHRVRFKTEQHAISFLEKAITQGYTGQYYASYDEGLPDGIDRSF